jgi:nicotinamide phosphoribosyltransferase
MLHQDNIMLNSDSYKFTQWNQYPPGTEYVYSYIESRGGLWDKTLFYGLQAFEMEYLSKPITMEQIDFAESIINAHIGPGTFYRKGWEHILKEHGGRLPVIIKSVAEGTLIPTKNVLVSIENTDPKCWWLTSFLETALLRAVWYPTTVATNSYVSKKIILDYLEKTGDPSLINFKLHDFGFRGVSSFESAALGGSAHLINFMGTDTIAALLAARVYYDADMAGFSIPAMEHSTVTSWGREHEVEAFRNMLKQYGKPNSLLACVSDSYDIYKACEKWGTELKQEVLDSGAIVVIRPDSGNPSEVVVKCLQILDKHFGHTLNEKGYRVLNNVRVIQGDGIDHASIRSILFCMEIAQYSADNVAFGQGGALLQQVNRDTEMFAMKCSAARVAGEWVDVYKQPATDSKKDSKKGRLMLLEHNDSYATVRWEEGLKGVDCLTTRFENGEIKNKTTFNEIRARASK